jgi:hypothetical protein
MVIQFDENGNFSEIKNCQPSDTVTHGKVIRKDKGEQHLFINNGNHINILFNVQGGRFAFEGNLRQFDGATIQDFRTIKTEGVLTACDNMQLYYHEIDQNQGSRLICKIDIGISVQERITSLNICPFNKFIAVATE